MKKNPGIVTTDGWVFYYLYALERCMSFRELIEQSAEKEPAWYNTGVEYILKTQRSDGSWMGPEANTIADTAFAVLFLMRSTKKSIEKAKSYGAGEMIGGRGLPKDTERAERRPQRPDHRQGNHRPGR